MFERSVKFNIIRDLESFPAVAILGPRQVGKTTLAKTLLGNGAIYLDLERPSDLSKLQDAETFFELHQSKMICLDEVQLRPDLFPIMRAVIDADRRPGRFLILGSSSPELLKQSAETLAGRLAYHHVTPLLADEIVIQQTKTESIWSKRLWRGGFPESYLAPSDEVSYRWRESYIQTFLERDLRVHFGIDVSPQKMRRLWLMCAHSNGQVLNYSKLGSSLDQTHPTIKSHIDVLESTFMVRRLLPFEVNLKKRLVKSPKLYVRDSGILSTLLDLQDFDQLYSHPAYGSCWESYAIENILATIKPKGMFGFFRTHQGDELDLVMKIGTKKIGFECKASSSPSISPQNHTAMQLLGLHKLYVVVPDGDVYPIEKDKVIVTPLPGIAKLVASIP
jgi:predicted AAA+ superfamily ATPase